MTDVEKQKHKPKSRPLKRSSVPIVLKISISAVALYLLLLLSSWFVPTSDDILSAYSNGQFRVIQTASTYMIWSSDYEYVSINRDGTYRISDGTKLSDISGEFSHTNQYLASKSDGIYRLPNFEEVVDIRVESISIDSSAYSERPLPSREIIFSENDQYVAITGAGPYRELAPSQSTDGFGIFRLSDGQ